VLFKKISFQVVSPLSVVPLKIGKNNCKPGETHRKTPFIHEIPTLYRANFAEDRHQHSRGGLSVFILMADFADPEIEIQMILVRFL